MVTLLLGFKGEEKVNPVGLSLPSMFCVVRLPRKFKD